MVYLLDVTDIYDEFSFGQKSSLAVREFLNSAQTNWRRKPQFLLLAGDATYDPKGYLFLATNNLHLDYLNRTGEHQRALGYEGVHLITQDEAGEMVPGLNVDDVVGGSFGPRDGFINPLALLEGFVVGANQRGVRVRSC